MEKVKTLKANGKGSYRSPYWFWPVMEGTGKIKPWDKIAKYHICLEKFEAPEVQNNSMRSCFYKVDIKKLTQYQKRFEYDCNGRVILLRQDIVKIMDKIENLTFIPLYYKGESMVMECVERKDCRILVRDFSKLMVISDQIRANKDRESMQWDYIPPSKNGKTLPNYKQVIDKGC